MSVLDAMRCAFLYGDADKRFDSNGKTISIKAMMHTLYQREDVVPTLYVKSLASFGGKTILCQRLLEERELISCRSGICDQRDLYVGAKDSAVLPGPRGS